MNKTVTITAGHSDTDSGAISRFSGDKEADIAVDMRNMLTLYLEREGVTVDTDGEGKENQSLNQAVKLISGGKLAIEIHCNSSIHSKAGGVEALADPRHLYVCQQLCKSISETMGIPLRGQDNGWKAEDSGQHSKLAYVSKGGIILEMFFISNPDELKIWKAKKWIVAKNLAAVILNSFEVLMTIAYFKRGDPFVLDMWLYDATIGLTEDPDDITRGIELVPEDVTIECQVNSIQGKKLGSLTFEAYEDQEANKGKFIFQNAEPTTTWPVGIAVFDVKVSLMGQIKHSMSFKFNIVETYTP